MRNPIHGRLPSDLFRGAVVTEGGQRPIVVGVNRSAASVAALRWAAAEAGLRRTTVHVVHAWERAAHRASYAVLRDSPDGAQEERRARAGLAAVLRAAFGDQAPEGVTAEVAEGVAERVLVARAPGAALLVLGGAGTDLAGRPAGPVIRACMHSAPCPLVIVTPPAGLTGTAAALAGLAAS
jgi:nucleotide-binding universal stress UspA family protein